MRRRRLFIAFLLGIMYCVFVEGLRAEHYLFTNLSENSWMIPRARTIYQEKGKYLWIGTTKGIYRFDGYDFTCYAQKYPANKIHSMNINYISMDNKGNLWILTDKGIGLYNKNTDQFESIEKGKVTNGPFFMTCQVTNGILFAVQGKIILYMYDNQQFTLFKDIHENGEIHNIKYMYNVNNDYIVLDYGSKIIKIDLQGNHQSVIPCPSVISCLFADNNDRIWAGCFDKSLTCFDENGNKIKEFSANNSDLTDEIILCMEQQDSLLWIGTDGDGINIINTKTNDIKTLSHISGELHSFPANSISCFHKDVQNTIWAGSVRDGIIAIRKSLISSYTEVYEGSKWGLSNPTVLSFYQDKNKDYVWIGTDGEGINRLDLNNRTFKHYPSTNGTKVVSIAKLDENTLILSLYTKGLFFFNIHTGAMRSLNVNKKELELKMLLSKTDINLYNHSSHHILALSDKVYKYNIETKKTVEVPFKTRKGFGVILPIGEIKNDLYLYNHAAIYKLDSCATQIETVFEMPKEVKIESTSIDATGNIWLATNQGVAFYSTATKMLCKIHNNLLRNISIIAADKKGRIWMGEEGKLYVYSDSTKNLAVFDKSDGVIPNDYIEKSHFLTHQGDVMIGGTRGLTIIDRNMELKTKEKPEIVITSIKIDNIEYNEYDIRNFTSIEVPSESKSIELQVTSIEEDILRPKIYRYELRGENKQIIESHSPILKLHSFNSGESEVYVSSNTRSGEWTSPTKVATLLFMPPWYETSWFYAVCMIIIIFVCTTVITTIFRRKENKLKLELKEKEKTIYEEEVKFLININHELRTPLTLISGPLHRILQTSFLLPEISDTLQKVYRQAERMKKLLNMVLDLRKMEEGESSINIQPIKVNDWIESVVSDFSYQNDNTSPNVTTSLEQNIGSVNLDKEKCEIVLTNLLVNAIKHSHSTDKIRVTSEISADKMLTISVIDEGEGLRNIQIEKLFNRFYQGSNEIGGSGIGLSYSKMLVNLHHGSIGAFNNETKGATFYFKIPLNLEIGNSNSLLNSFTNEELLSNTTSVVQDTVNQTEDFETKHKSILIVDDNVELTAFLKDSFDDKFKSVHLAHNGKKAYEIIKKEDIDIIVSDIMMPEMNGYELCQKVKSNMECSHIPIILLTAVGEERSRRQGYKMGADAYVDKPFVTETLYEIIKSKLKIREDIKRKYMRLSVLPEPQKDTFSQVDETFLMNLNKIVVDNISDVSLDIPFVCKEIGMSRASLYNKLKALTNMSCNEYINKIRMERAIMLVKTTTKSFVEIADETGFANSRYFSTTFKQNTGMTPTQYRKEYRAKP